MSRALSVVVPHFGPPHSTRDLMDRLNGQRGDLDLQVIIVDDASPEPFPDITGAIVVRRTVNGGFGSAVNSGAAMASRDHMLVLNSDVEFGPTFLADLMESAAPWQPAVVSPGVLNHDGQQEWVGRNFPTATHQCVEWLTPLARFRSTEAWHRHVGHDVGARGRTAVVDWVIGAAMLIPTSQFRAVGGFDERFFMNAEEVDLQRRLAQRGVRSIVLAEPSLIHVGGGSSDPGRRRRWLVDSRMKYAEKWGGRRRLRAALTAATAVNLAANGARRLVGSDIAPLNVAREELNLIWRPSR